MRASSPVTVGVRLDTTATSIWPGVSGGVVPPKNEASTVTGPDPAGAGVARACPAGRAATTAARAAAHSARRRGIQGGFVAGDPDPCSPPEAGG